MRFFIAICFILNLFQLTAQSLSKVQVDSKVEEIKATIRSGSGKTDSILLAFDKFTSSKGKYAEANAYFLKGYQQHAVGQYDKAIEYYKKSVIHLSDSTSKFGVDLINRIGNCYRKLSEQQKAAVEYQSALALSKTIDYHKGSGDAYQGIGRIYEQKGEYKKTMNYYIESNAAYEEAGDSTGIASSYNDMGNLMYYQGELEQAIDYYKKSIEIDQSIGNKLNAAMGYGNLGMIYQQMGKLDSALSYNLSCMKVLEQINNPFYLGTVYNNIALVYFDMEDYKTSLAYHQKSKAIKLEIGDKSGLATSLINIGNIHVKLKDYRSAIPYYKEGMEVCNQVDAPVLKKEGYKGLAEAYRNTGKYDKALDNYVLYQEIHDSLNNIESKNHIAELETKYETAKKEAALVKEKEEHKREIALQEAKSKNQQLIIFGSGILLVAIVIFALIFYGKYKQTQEQKVLIEEKNKENELLLGEIHHRVKNNLQVISSLLSLHEKSLSDEGAKKAILEGKERVKSMGLIHKMLYQNDNFSGIEMQAYVEKLVDGLMESFGKSKENFDLNIDFKDYRLDVDTAIPIGLMLNELVINALKYAYDKTEKPYLKLALKKSDENIALEVEDNGDGDVEKVEKSDSFGVKLVRSLVRQLNGEIKLEKKKGLRYLITIKDFKLV